jgi:hypothetical protein
VRRAPSTAVRQASALTVVPDLVAVSDRSKSGSAIAQQINITGGVTASHLRALETCRLFVPPLVCVSQSLCRGDAVGAVLGVTLAELNVNGGIHRISRYDCLSQSETRQLVDVFSGSFDTASNGLLISRVLIFIVTCVPHCERISWSIFEGH